MPETKTRLAIRGYAEGQLRFEEFVDAEPGDMEQLAFKHAMLLADVAHMIDFEFLDEPDPGQRFFRMGTDPSRMVMPVRAAIRGEGASAAEVDLRS